MTRCTKCEALTIEDNGFSICSECGVVQKTVYFVSSINTFNDPIQICFYQRKKRFEKILDQITLPRIENKDIPVYKKLDGNLFDTVDDLKLFIKSLNVQDKRYHSLHAFAKRFVTSYKQPSEFTTHNKQCCLYLFEKLECCFLRHMFNVPFFNYAWLIRKILNMLHFSQFDMFIKRIKCPKRNKYYNDMFTFLHTKILIRDDV